jgi:hypothetical protein
MSRHSNSSLFLIGMASMVAVWVSVPFWSRSPQKGEKTVKVVKTPVPVISGFQYAVPEGNPRRANVEERGYNQEQLKRQLDRRAHMEKAGLVKNVIENEAMPNGWTCLPKNIPKWRRKVKKIRLRVRLHPMEVCLPIFRKQWST